MIDITHVMKDAGLVAASVAGQVDSEDKIVDVGAGLVEGQLVIDCTAIEIDSNNELYQISLQGCASVGFTNTFTDLAVLELGANEVVGGDVDSETGRYKVPFISEKNGVIYPFLRVYTACAGSIAAGINYSAYLRK
jgi:hypothetical protein